MIGIRGLGSLGIGAVLLLLPAEPATGALEMARCEPEYLNSPSGGRHVYVSESDPTGRWLAGHADPAESVVVVWHRDEGRELDLPYGSPSAGGIDRRGTVVGTGYASVDDRERGGGGAGFAYVEDAVVELATPRGSSGVVVTGISRDGTISGWSTRNEGRDRAVVWSLDRPDKPSRLRLSARWPSRAVDISEDGHVAALLSGAGGHRSFVFPPDGNRFELSGTTPEFRVEVRAIANGWAAGFERSPSSGEVHVLRWNLGTGAMERIPEGFTEVTAINRHGVVAGDDVSTALLYSDHYIELPPFDPKDQTHAAIVTDKGDAAGFELFWTDVGAVRWNCRGVLSRL